MTEPTPAIEQKPPTATIPKTSNTAREQVHLPRIAIAFCTQCRWMLRAAYFAQELLSTFSTDLGEVALVPVTGGVFTVTIWHASSQMPTGSGTEVGLGPDTKILKSLVRNVIAPDRDLGHTDRALKEEAAKQSDKKECEDCK
ncbi:hypothetical protein N7474_009094 [Penicillium riverlandense]|uniref:uncharacterized protein n=1 Tax=Penicillium riverlandense TaxID=1903569 RepID=UPI00254952DF|nr:uncharacterized protein N7474_009094 [Penicillium riverlandense]KAJ5807825.1 hypothetical protein N7474_009094 [Penicillium riverlandense]